VCIRIAFDAPRIKAISSLLYHQVSKEIEQIFELE